MASYRKMWKVSVGVGSCLTAGTLFKLFKGNTEKKIENVSENSDADSRVHDPISLEDLELKMVQIFMRHGARTPLHLIKDIEQATYEKEFLLASTPHTVFEYQAVDMDGSPRPFSKYEAIYEKKILKGGSTFGRLTVTGQDQMYLVGKELRKQYIERLNLIDSVYNPEQVHVRSTNIDRTLATARCVLAGMYGHLNLDSLQDPPKIYTKESKEDELLPQTGKCKVLHQINHSAMVHAVDGPDMKPDILKIKDVLGIDCPSYKLNFVDMRDDLVAREAHGLPVPAVLQPFRSVIETNASKIIYYAFCGQHEAERNIAMQLSSGALFKMMVDNIEEANKKTTKLYLFSCHDSTLVAMLGVLNIYDFTWPPFGANIRFELYENKAKQQFVRVLYNGETRVVRGCTSGICPLSEFKQGMSPYMINKKDYIKLCDSDILKIIAKEMLAQEKEEEEVDPERSDIPAGM